MEEFKSYINSVYYKEFDRKTLLKLLSQYLSETAVRREVAKDYRDRYRLSKRATAIGDLVEALSDENDCLE